VVSIGGSVAAEFSSKMPLRLEFRIANVGRIHFYLAPRVQD
jgi:proliferating cell nuclear antigen